VDAVPTPAEAAALDAIETSGVWEFDGRALHLTNLDKVMFPAAKGYRALTKRDVIRHYATVSSVMVPYLAARPVNVQRFPNGTGSSGFWQKAAPKHAPDWIPRWHNAGAAENRTEFYLVVDSPAALVWIANYGGIEIHPWASTVRDPLSPTWAMIDIDPGKKTSWDEVLTLARMHRTALEHLGVRAAPKVTGQRGIQIWVPVADGYTYAETGAWVEGLSRAIGAIVPELVSWEWEVAKRKGRSRLDFTQNAIGKTLVAPFSIRPAPGAPVSVPIGWDELDDPDLRPDRWTISSIADRLVANGDPMAPLLGLQQALPDVAAA
jgi:bifunctional non-homologous end joining protein LigD